MCIVFLSHQPPDTILSMADMFLRVTVHLESAIKAFHNTSIVVTFFCGRNLHFSCHLLQHIYLSTYDITAAMHIFSLKGELVISHLSNNTQEKQKALLRRLGFAMMMIKFIRTISSSSYNTVQP